MTLFIKTPKRDLEMSDLYVMALSFIISFAVGKIVKSVIKKQEEKRKNLRKTQFSNPRGGGTELQLSDDNDIALTILQCMADNERYLVTDPEIRQLIFNLVKVNLKNTSLSMTPNMIRFLALQLINNDQTLVVKIGNVLVSSSNKTRLFVRLLGATAIGFTGALLSTFSYTVLLLLIYFDNTENCGSPCKDAFQKLPDGEIVKIYAEKDTGNLVITDQPNQVEIYTPAKDRQEVINSDTGKQLVVKEYRKSKKKAKEVKFSEFKKTDPVLAAFGDDLQEPDVPQQRCSLPDPHDLIGIYVE